MTQNPSRHHDLDWAQLARYFGGELAPGEARALEHWFDQDDESRRVLIEARAAWEASAAPNGRWVADAEAGVQRLRRAIAAMPLETSQEMLISPALPSDSTVAEPARQRPARPIRPPRLVWRERRLAPAALAASLAALAISTAALWSLHRGSSAVHPAPVAMTEVATSRGQRADVLLPDGSRVTLGVASRLRYPRDFGVGERTVQLDGEAYFDVVHDDARPFRVRAGAAEFEDVGTAFVVRSYDTSAVRVVVTEGVVVARRVIAPKDSVVLAAADLADVDDRGIERRVGVSTHEYTAWMQGELAFRDATLAAVAEELSRWYDVEIQVGNPAIANHRFTGSFGRQSVDAVVQEIAAAADVTAERVSGGWRFR